MPTKTAAPSANAPTQTEALLLASAWLKNRDATQQLAAEKAALEQQLFAYFETTDEKALAGVLCYSRPTTSTAIVPTLKTGKRDDLIAGLLDDAAFTAFIGERVMGDEVVRAAAEHKGLRAQLDKYSLVSRHLDETALAKAAQDNAQVAAALKAHKLAATVTVEDKWYLKSKA